MDRFQKIDKQLTSQRKKLHHNNVDLTLRLGLPNHAYSEDNIETGQSLNSNLFTRITPQHANLNHGSHMNTTRGQPYMEYWEYGHGNNMVSGGHSIAANNYNMIINSTTTGGPNSYSGRFNKTGVNYMQGQIINTGAGAQIHSHHQHYPNNIALMNDNHNPHTSSTAFSPQLIQLNGHTNNNILHINHNTMSRGQSSGRKNNISQRKQRGHGHIDERLQAQAVVLDAGDREEEEEEVILIEDITDVVRDHIVEEAKYKQCSNPDCGTQTTPMWRRGPLGPKTLCNACGIKYRKQEEKRAARLATPKAGNSTNH